MLSGPDNVDVFFSSACPRCFVSRFEVHAHVNLAPEEHIMGNFLQTYRGGDVNLILL